MARARMLKPSFFTNEELGQLPPLARLLFQGLWTVADREGRLEDRPLRLKVELLPYDEADVDALLSQLHEAGFIVRYEASGGRWIQVVSFAKHQRPHPHEPASATPEPDESQHTITGRGIMSALGKSRDITSQEPGSKPESEPDTNRDMTRPDRESKAESITESITESSSDPSDRVPPAPSVCRDNFFRGRKPNEWMAAVIDLWQAPLSKEQCKHLGGLLKRRGHGQKVWDAAEASKDAADPVQFMERILSDGKAKQGDSGSGKKAKSPFAQYG